MQSQHTCFVVHFGIGTVSIPSPHIDNLLDLKTRIELETGVKIKHQRLYRNQLKMREPDETRIQQLNFQPTDRLELVERGRKKKTAVDRLEQSVKFEPLHPNFYPLQQQPLVARKEKEEATLSIDELAQKLRIKGCLDSERYARMAEGNKRLAYYLCDEGLPEITPSLFTERQHLSHLQSSFLQINIFQKHREKFIRHDGFIEFVCKKLAEKNHNLSFLRNRSTSIREKVFQVRPPMTAEEQLNLAEAIQGSLESGLVALVQKLGVSRARATRIVQISENNQERCIKLAYEDELFQQFNIRSPDNHLEQSIFIHKWFMHPTRHLLLLKLKLSTKYLDSYTLSMKHLCPQFYQLLLKHRSFVESIIDESQPDIYRVRT